MDSADHLSQSIDLVLTTIHGADPARYDDPSPCADFTVGQLVNHIAFGLLLAHRSATREVWDPAWTAADRTPFLRGRPVGEWADACAQHATATRQAWADPAVWEGESHLGGSPMAAATVGSIMTAEFAVHAWDLAVATGQPLEVPPGLGQVVLDGVSAMAPGGRAGGWFAPQVPVPSAAGAFERALGESGRDPGQWHGRRIGGGERPAGR